jgi:zinc protease
MEDLSMNYKMFLSFLGIAFCAVAFAGSPAAKKKIFPYEMKRFTMDNGLRVVAIPYDSPGIVAYYTVVRTGSRNEIEPGKSGFAHFFEHIMFRGTDKYSAEAYGKTLKALGADNNAFTDDDWTCYHTVLPAGGLEKIIDLESDRFKNLKYSEDAFKTEAGAILGEYNKSSSSPFQALFEKIGEAAFLKHTYGHTTIGYLKDIKNMPNEYPYSLDFHDRWYRPENCTVIVVGDFDYDRLSQWIKKYYADWKPKNYKQEIVKEDDQTAPRRLRIDWPSKTLPIIFMSYKSAAFSAENREYAALDILGTCLFGETSDLYKELVLDKQQVERLAFMNMDRRDPSLFHVYSRVKDEKNIEAVERTMDAAIEKAKTELLSDDRLKAIKSRMKYSFAMSLTNPDRVAVTIGNFVNLTGDPNAVNDLYDRYDEVSAQDVQAAAKKYLDKNRCTTAILKYVTQ